MSAYERVTFCPEAGKRKTVLLRRPTVAGELLTGIEVNDQGDEVAPRGVDERRHVISLDLVCKRVPMEMDNHFGELIVVECKVTQAGTLGYQRCELPVGHDGKHRSQDRKEYV